MSQTSSSHAVAEWLRSRVDYPITARSTWSSAGRIYHSDENVIVVPLPTPEAKPGGFAATYRANVTVDGEPLKGDLAVRAEILDSRVAREKRAVAMGLAQIGGEDRTAAKVLPTPWHTVEVRVSALELGWGNDADQTIGLDIMRWAEPFESAFEGVPEPRRVERAIELAIPLFSGLDHIHSHCARVHRDIHPDNIRYAVDHLVFIDWGISSVMTSGTSTVTTAFGKFTSAYPAPEARTEQGVVGGQEIGADTDAWAMGALLCKMACGQSPKLLDIDSGEIALPRAAQHLPGWLSEVIDGLTQHDRGARMTLSEAISALRDAGSNLNHLGAWRSTTTSSSTTAAPVTREARTVTGTLIDTESDIPGDQGARAHELLAAGYTRGAAGRAEAALAAYADVVGMCEGDPDPTLRRYFAMALNNTQWELYRSNQQAEAQAACSRLVDAVGHDSDPVLRQQVAIALNGRAYAKRDFGLTENAVADWDEVVDRFGGDPDLILRHQVAMALRDTGLALADLDRRMDALSAFTRLIESFDRDPEPVIRQQVAMALNNKRSCLYGLGHHAEAAAACTRLAETFGSDRDPVIRQQVAVALHSKGLILERSGQPEGALAAYGRLIDIFADDPDPTAQSSVAWARERLRNR